ncbi:uncharacterized protein BT62DRAFT_888190, partial [Guyanagaster necrorhizus]
QVLILMRKYKLFLKAEKCKFKMLKTEYLDIIISKESICIDLIKIQSIMEWLTPIKKDSESFLDFTNFYQHLIKDYSQII